MVNIGQFNNLKVARMVGSSYYLDGGTGKMGDDILLPQGNITIEKIEVGDIVRVFIYRDSEDRIIATMKEPLASVGDIAYLKVVACTRIGCFVDFGLERDILVPLKEQNYRLEVDKSYLLYIYVDKTGRLAATTLIDKYLKENEEYKLGDEVKGTVYGFQTNGSAMVAVDNIIRGVILRNEYFTDLEPGQIVDLRVKKIYEDGKLGLTPRKAAVAQKLKLEDEIIKYLNEHDGFMPYNDKSSPEEIKEVFHESKNYFKNALGGLMKRRLIVQDEKGTRLMEFNKGE